MGWAAMRVSCAGPGELGSPCIRAERRANFQQNPGNWVPESVHAEATTSVRVRGGVSEQILYRNTQTGETMWRHRITDANGRLWDDHPRGSYKPRVGEVD